MYFSITSCSGWDRLYRRLEGKGNRGSRLISLGLGAEGYSGDWFAIRTDLDSARGSRGMWCLRARVSSKLSLAPESPKRKWGRETHNRVPGSSSGEGQDRTYACQHPCMRRWANFFGGEGQTGQAKMGGRPKHNIGGEDEAVDVLQWPSSATISRSLLFSLLLINHSHNPKLNGLLRGIAGRSNIPFSWFANLS